jgi:hypothetical protein
LSTVAARAAPERAVRGRRPGRTARLHGRLFARRQPGPASASAACGAPGCLPPRHPRRPTPPCPAVCGGGPPGASAHQARLPRRSTALVSGVRLMRRRLTPRHPGRTVPGRCPLGWPSSAPALRGPATGPGFASAAACRPRCAASSVGSWSHAAGPVVRVGLPSPSVVRRPGRLFVVRPPGPASLRRLRADPVSPVIRPAPGRTLSPVIRPAPGRTRPEWSGSPPPPPVRPVA